MLQGLASAGELVVELHLPDGHIRPVFGDGTGQHAVDPREQGSGLLGVFQEQAVIAILELQDRHWAGAVDAVLPQVAD